MKNSFKNLIGILETEKFSGIELKGQKVNK